MSDDDKKQIVAILELVEKNLIHPVKTTELKTLIKSVRSVILSEVPKENLYEIVSNLVVINLVNE